MKSEDERRTGMPMEPKGKKVKLGDLVTFTLPKGTDRPALVIDAVSQDLLTLAVFVDPQVDRHASLGFMGGHVGSAVRVVRNAARGDGPGTWRS